MKKKKLLSILSTGALALSLLSPLASNASTAEAATVPKWDAERYGDRVDIDGKLNAQSEDSSFLKQAEKKIEEQAAQINFDEVNKEESKTADSTFTYNGGTKYFLDRELAFKQFTLRSVGENVEIWVANDLSFPDDRPAHVVTQEQVDKLRDEFDRNIYPKATSFYGTPDTHDGSKSPLAGRNVPKGYYEGSDKVIMLVDNIKDDGYYDPSYPFFVAGFFWQTLENYMDRNIITIDTNSWETRLESTFFGTTIHELQHLIHADNDGAEETWINEGMSTFSEYLGGYGHDAGSINFYLDHPENSLVNWDDHRTAETGPETIADYGQVYLFTLYMNDKFGQEFIRDLALNETQGIDSVNQVLKAHGSTMDFTQLYQNFITALTLDSNKIGEGIYDFNSINLRGLLVDKEGTKRGMTVNFEKALEFEKDGVPAWGGDFKELDFQDKINGISFDGVDFLPIPWESAADPLNSGNQVLWGNKGDEADNALIFEADLSGVETATLKFDNFIDIEEQWDFGVVQVSTDGGNTWKSLSNENTRSDVVEEGYPKIKENVPGFTGHYEEWQEETFDLSEYAGQKVLVSFRYLTDWGYNDSGWFIDNIEIPEIGYSHDGSSTEGFKSMNEILGKYVNYTVTFVNEREVGNKKGKQNTYKVVTVDPFNVTEENALQLRQLFQDGKNYMITSYAAPADNKNAVDFTYEVELKEDKKK
ncbi:immune inhibitor A peptidase M6 [Cytobacillus oceanisediminis]|uniref:Immune inhibitor A peptidase M6 n=1 Tax=Cytobacillus oceanisediminis TaxID=665099 RepID=A0A2V3A5N0_9BACI|nr:immune inhibitor A domain-containing protein [Cytobacillus oceanisediminis]PWW31069.1 immune inhibitor A peptidase M6 [Cytobacillus oceanisediminis]